MSYSPVLMQSSRYRSLSGGGEETGADADAVPMDGAFDDECEVGGGQF